jgi:hypothetical protein
MKSGQISALGASQLDAWEKIADGWILVPTWRDELPTTTVYNRPVPQLHFVCPNCDTSVFAASEQSFTPSIIKAATVAHLRNRHRECDPDA